jgi:hypothetical protein
MTELSVETREVSRALLASSPKVVLMPGYVLSHQLRQYQLSADMVRGSSRVEIQGPAREPGNMDVRTVNGEFSFVKEARLVSTTVR